MLSNKKILCLGNTTRNTDDLTTQMANSCGSINHGLITDPNITIVDNGFYHSTVSDMEVSLLAKLGKQFDKVIIFDQAIETFDNESLFHKTRQVGMLIRNRYNKDVEIVDATAT